VDPTSVARWRGGLDAGRGPGFDPEYVAEKFVLLACRDAMIARDESNS
jgi:hypothetical protein